MPSGVIGVPPGAIGIAVVQQSLRAVSRFCSVNAVAADSMCCGVVPRPSEMRTAATALNSLVPIARSTFDAISIPEWHADQVDAATPAA